jgi:hypothetical protein
MSKELTNPHFFELEQAARRKGVGYFEQMTEIAAHFAQRANENKTNLPNQQTASQSSDQSENS